MKKQKICILISIFLITGFLVKTVIDYFNYNDMTNSAPFYVFVLYNILIFIVPSFIFFILNLIFRR